MDGAKDAVEVLYDHEATTSLLMSTDCVKEAAALMSHLQEIGRELAEPIYLRAELVLSIELLVDPGAIALRADGSEAVLAIGVYRGFSEVRLAKFAEEFAKGTIHYQSVDPDRIMDRAALVDVMSELLVCARRAA